MGPTFYFSLILCYEASRVILVVEESVQQRQRRHQRLRHQLSQFRQKLAIIPHCDAVFTTTNTFIPT